MQAIKMLPKQYEIVTATTDHLAGEVGTIYQACNFHYVGAMRESNPNIKGKTKNRLGVIINGKLYGSRAIRSKIGTQKKEEILKHFPDAQFVKQLSKHRYFYFRSNKDKHFSAIKDIVKPFPKRDG